LNKLSDKEAIDIFRIMMIEEAAELLVAEDESAVLDALTDLMGVALKMLSFYDKNRRIKAGNDYVQSQVARGRKVRTHNHAIDKILSTDEFFSVADAQEVKDEQDAKRFDRLPKTIGRVSKSLDALMSAEMGHKYDSPIHFIMAPSCSGKSHLISTYKGDIQLRDFDDLVKNTIGWPLDAEWWKNKSADEFYDKLKLMIKLIPGLKTSYPIVFLGNSTDSVMSIMQELGLLSSIVLIPESLHRDYIKKGEHHRTVDDLLASFTTERSSMREFADKHHTPVYDSFETALSKLVTI